MRTELSNLANQTQDRLPVDEAMGYRYAFCQVLDYFDNEIHIAEEKDRGEWDR